LSFDAQILGSFKPSASRRKACKVTLQRASPRADRVAPHVVKALLGHVTKGVAGVCNRARYEREQRAALARWDAHVGRLVAGKPAKKVVPFPRRRA
jgi:hypothetical protein